MAQGLTKHITLFTWSKGHWNKEFATSACGLIESFKVLKDINLLLWSKGLVILDEVSLMLLLYP